MKRGGGDCKNVCHRVVVIFNYLKGVPVSLLKHEIEFDGKGGELRGGVIL